MRVSFGGLSLWFALNLDQWTSWARKKKKKEKHLKEMATHSSTLVWKIPWMEEPGRLQSTGSQRVGQTEQLHLTLT